MQKFEIILRHIQLIKSTPPDSLKSNVNRNWLIVFNFFQFPIYFHVHKSKNKKKGWRSIQATELVSKNKIYKLKNDTIRTLKKHLVYLVLNEEIWQSLIELYIRKLK